MTTKDVVENRNRLPSAHKLRVFGLSLRENGIWWTGYLGAYYLASALADWAHRRMMAVRKTRGLPGINSSSINRAIWENWDWDNGGEEWTPSPDWKDSLITNVLEKYIRPDAHVLEIGPGAGRWTESLLRLSAHLTAVDVSQKCIEICRAKFAEERRATFLVNQGADLGRISNESIDTICSIEVFVHINCSEVDRYVGEFHRVLKPGGRGIIHHGAAAGTTGGWRSDMSASDFVTILERRQLRVVDQFSQWNDESRGRRFNVSNYGDVITVFEKPAGGR